MNNMDSNEINKDELDTKVTYFKIELDNNTNREKMKMSVHHFVDYYENHTKDNKKYCTKKQYQKSKITQKKVRIYNQAQIIHDARFLKYNFHLTTLQITGHNITNLDCLKSLFNLKYLSIVSNKITCINFVSSLTNLEVFFCDNNDITHLGPLKNCTKLKMLDCCKNINLKEINVLKYFKNLERFACFQNENIEAICDLSHNVELKELFLDLKKITKLSGIKYCQKLKYLSIRNGNRLDMNTFNEITLLKKLEYFIYSHPNKSTIDKLLRNKIKNKLQLHDN